MTSDDLGLPQSPAQAAEGVTDEMVHAAMASWFDEFWQNGQLVGVSASLAETAEQDMRSAIEAALSAEGSAIIAAARQKDGFALYPVEPTDAMVKAGVTFALKVSLGGDYRWQDYMRDLYHVMTSASFPEDQEKAAATPTIADPDGEARA